MKLYVKTIRKKIFESLPVRGAWIEIKHLCGFARLGAVAPRAGSVD